MPNPIAKLSVGLIHFCAQEVHRRVGSGVGACAWHSARTANFEFCHIAPHRSNDGCNDLHDNALLLQRSKAACSMATRRKPQNHAGTQTRRPALARSHSLRILREDYLLPANRLSNTMLVSRAMGARVYASTLGFPRPQQPDPFDRHSSPRDRAAAAARKSTSRANCSRGANFKEGTRRRGRPAHMRSPDDSPLRDGNRDR